MNDNFASLFAPKAVAVIGASDNPNKVGGRPIHYMKKYGFGGQVFPINPGRAEVQGYKAYPDIREVPVTPEAVIIAVGTDSVIPEVQRCAAMGVRTALVMSSGFGELGESGQQRERELVRVAAASGMRVMGPNCQGSANFSNGAILNFSTMFADISPLDGPIAVVSQSGAASVMPYALLREAGLGIRYVIASGNDADLSASALAQAVAQDPDIRLILVYLEQLNDPECLAAAARIAKERGAYVVVLKSGSSEKGMTAAASHTGAVMGNDAAIDAYLAKSGIWRARDIKDFIRAAPLYLDNRPVGAGRAVAMSHSGAVAVMTADLAERTGLPLADLSVETKARLSSILPAFGTAHNPLDMTAAILNDATMFPRVLDAIGNDPQGDTVLVSVPVAGPGYDLDAFASAAAAFVAREDKPMVLSAPQSSVREIFRRHDIPVFDTEADAVLAIDQYSKHQHLRDKLKIESESEAIVGLPSGLQDEFASLKILSEHGIPVVDHAICRTPEEAAVAFEKLGGVPVVVKGCAAAIPHKTEHGLVHLGVVFAEAVREMASNCLSKLAELGVAEPRVIVAAMVKGVHEIALGVKVDEKLGPLVMIADGGTLVELRKDAVSLIAPFSEQEVKEVCARLRIAPLFDGYRGGPKLDVDALVKAVVALGAFAARSKTSLEAVDINPLLLLPEGQGVVAVDAVVELR